VPGGAPEGLSFILPVCNQAAALERALTAWAEALSKLKRPYEILIVDDGSTDETTPYLAQLKGTDDRPGTFAHLRIFRHESRRGYGACLRTAIAEATQPLLFYTGLDYAYAPADLPRLLERLEHVEPPDPLQDGLRDPEPPPKLDLVNGFRALTPVPLGMRIIGAMWRGFLHVLLGLPTAPLPGWLGWPAQRYLLQVRALFGVRLRDIDSKFKLFRRKIFERFPIQSDGDFVHAEILAKANFLGCYMDEVPVAERPGAFAPVPEPPAAPPTVREEMTRVFRHPMFLPPPSEPQDMKSAVSESPKEPALPP
jgi:glycosyltransferase involved in cell wall biosynthesis